MKHPVSLPASQRSSNSAEKIPSPTTHQLLSSSELRVLCAYFLTSAYPSPAPGSLLSFQLLAATEMSLGQKLALS